VSRTNIENIYPLSPMQQGMLFETLAGERGVYFIQIAWTLRGDLDAAAFLRAWQEVTDRHPILRTGFAWERLERPVQVVRRRATLPVHEEDLRGLPAAEQQDRVARFLAADREQGFDLTKPPLMRVALFRLAEDAYRFVWSRHHLLLDGWSTPLVVKDVFATYEARRRGEEPALERPRPFGEYIGWLVKQDAKKLEAFWRGRLGTFSEPTALRVDHAAVGEPRPEERRLVLSEDASARLQAFARQHQLTLSTLVQGAWALLLSRYSGEDDVLFGATVSGRSAPVPGIDRMVGMFINTVPVRVAVAPAETALGYLTQLHQQQVELRDHEHAALVDVQGYSGVPRGTPLFESLVVYENYPVEDALRQGSGGLTVADSRTIERSSVPITVVAQLRRALTLQIGYDAARFDGDAVERMLAHLAALMEGFAAQPGVALADLSMLPEAERELVVSTWNRTAAPYREGLATHELFEEHAARAPDAVALVFGREEVRYGELDRRANRLAHHLRGMGVGASQRVGISVQRSPAMMVAVLAVLKAGGAYVPLDPTYPPDRLAFMIEDAGLAVLLTEQAVAADLPAHAVRTVLLDAEAAAIAAQPDTKPEVKVGLGDAAYVIYTSGSTGKPKGVIIPHRGLANVAAVHQRAFGCGPDLRVLQFSSFSFDAAVWELAMSLLNGGALVLAPQEQLVGPELLTLIETQNVNGALIPPSLLATLPDAALPGFRCLISGGEACSAELAARWAPGRAMWNAYGPTEITIFATLGPITADGGRPRLGPPIGNTRVYVLDARLRPQPIGVPGELCLAGIGLATGYLNRPELTAEKFVADPFVPGEKMYRTGDLGRWLPDGTLDYLGRIDHQVKLRGFRIELGEIESALLAHPAVREVVVVAREDGGDKRLVGYLVAAEAHEVPGITELRAFLKATLPEFMVPSAFVALPRLPQTPSGKLDRRALPAPEAFAATRTFVAPRGPVEEEVARIFAEVLRLPAEQIGAHDGFFELGGHSLHATQVVARLRAALGADLPLRELFDASTPAELAARVQAALGAKDGAPPPLVKVPRGGPLLPSFGQERLWFLQQLDPGDMSYVIPVTVRLQGALDVGALSRALAEILRRHEVLRTTYVSVGDKPRVFVHDAAEVPLPLLDLGSVPAGERDGALRAAVNEGMAKPFDLASGPLLRAQLIALGPEDHVLYLTTHHIASDGWSQGLLHAEITALYEAFAAGRPSPLPELPVQYADFAAWQRAYLTGDVHDKQMGYWRERLTGAPLLDLPTDRPRPPVQSTRGALRTAVLSPELTRSIKELCRREGVTLFMTLVAAFDVLLSRYTGQDDIVIGTPIAGRNRAEVESLFGFFVNALVLRTQLDDGLSFRDLLQRVRETCLGAYAHQDVPFERLVQDLAPARDLSRTPIFQVLISMQNAPRAAHAPAGLKAASVRAESPTSKYDLTLMLSDTERGLVLLGEYAVDLFDAETMDRLLGHYRAILEAAVRAPAEPIGSIRLLSPEEELRVLVQWNDTEADYPRDRTVVDLFDAQVARTPDAVAVVAGEERLTYAELATRANKVAHHLRAMSVGPDTLVGLCVSRSAAMVVGLLGVLKAGGAYVALDPTLPMERLAWMLDDSAVTVVVTEERIADELPVAAMVVRLDADWPMIESWPAEAPEGGAKPENLAYVIYTSGSTGKPKGVLIQHGGLVNYLWWALTAYDAAGGSGSPVHSSVGFDLTVTSLFTPLLAGRTAVLVPEENEIEALAGALAAPGGFSLVKLTPAHLELMSHLVPAAAAGGATRVFVIGGEALSWETLAFWRQHAPDTRLINEYGPTETVVGCSTYDGARPGTFTGVVPIGKPIANTRLYVLDRALRPVPVGVRGELYIGGAGVARGYLNRPELTAERFLADPFGEDPQGKLYKSGDLARWLPSGDLEFLGRVDHQVKIRGYRIELGEIEATLGAHPGLAEVAVAVREDSPGDKRLVAYIVAADEPAPEPAELRAYLGQRLPEYMVPAAYVRLPALPLTPNGKLDRRALPAPESSDVDGAHLAPRNAIEEMIAGIWCDILGVAAVGVTDDFFVLGGHSLLATQVIGRIATSLGVELPLQSIFEAPTVAGLADRVAELRLAGEGLVVPPLVRVPRDGDLPLSFAQERLWFMHQLDPQSPFYNVPSALRLEGKLDARALELALRAIVRRHEVLRTTFAARDGRPAQIIHPEASLDLGVVAFTDLAPEAREQAARAETLAEARRPFDLEKGPVIRARLLVLGEEDHVLLVTLHHIVSDGFTRGIINRELATYYRAFHAGEEPRVAELPVQYADYAAWQRGWLSGPVLDRQIAYWKGQLEGAPFTLELPTDKPRPPTQSFRGARLVKALPAELLQKLEELARREGVTLYMLLLAALDVLLHRWTGQRDLLVGTSVSTRTRAETEPLLGFFINALVLRARVSGEEPFTALLHRVRETCLGAYAHQDMPFERLVQELHPDPDPSRAPLFQVIFTMQNVATDRAELAGLSLRGMPADIAAVKYDLTFLMGPLRDGSLGLTIEYCVDLFAEATIERMIGHLASLLGGIAADAERPVRELPMMAEGERQKLFEAWNEAPAPLPVAAFVAAAPESPTLAADVTVHELFQAQAARTPEVTAVVCGDQALTFKQLEESANRVTRRLIALGVAPGSVVGICLPRSVDVIVAMLGIMKAGGAYVPLDPAYPPQRLAGLVAEAGVEVVLTVDRLADALPGTVTLVRFDGDAKQLAALNPKRLDGGAGPTDLAYVLFTSGSTGKPKGVGIEHRNLVAYVRGVASRLELGGTWSYAHISTFSADLGNTVLFPPLCLGGTLHVIPEELTTDPARLGAYFTEHGVDCLKIVPSHLSALMSGSGPHPEQVLPRKLLVLGGEASSWELVARIEALAPGCRIANHYGPTETTVGVLTYAVPPTDRPASPIVPLGRPLPGARVYVLDGEGAPTPLGVPGEVYLGGAGVARGYLGRPELTAERFVRDPFVPDPEARMYRTGDRARWLPEGVLLFLGRIDNQVKIRGFRVELGEIEAAINGHPGVRESVVLVHEPTPGDKRLVAYVVVRPAEGPSPAELRAYLAERLPEYMVPSVIHIIDSLPLTPNGKIDRQSLLAMAVDDQSDELVAPRTPIEDVLAALWQDVFERDAIGVHERFGDLGGHSLLAIQIIARARDAFQIDVPLRAIFETPTIAGLAERIEGLLREGGGLVVPRLAPAPRGGSMPLSFAQERLWFLHQLEPENPSYNVPAALRLEGPLDVPALERALGALVQRHEALRTTFRVEDGSPVQVIHPEARLDLAVVRLAELAPADRAEAMRREIVAEARLPFDLEAGPLFRARLLVLGEADHVLCTTLHHIVSDGWTRGLLNRDLTALYGAFAAGTEPSLPPLALQYADYAAWQRGWLAGEALDRQIAYWKERLAGAPPVLELPTDRPRPPVQSYRGGQRQRALPPTLRDGLRELSRREGVTLFTTLLAAFDVLLHRISGQGDLVVGTAIAGRSDVALEDVVGFFVNVLALRAEVDGAEPFRALLARVHEACLGAYAHQDMPFERLVQELDPARDPGRPPLVQVTFALNNAPGVAVALPGLALRGTGGGAHATAKYDLQLAVTEAPGTLSVAAAYASDLFDAATIDRLLAAFEQILEAVVATPDRAVGDLPLLTPDERRTLTVAWNDTATPHDERPAHVLFAEQVARTPEALAVLAGEQRLTFGALAARSHRLAHHLQSLGVGPEVLVGVALPRSPEVVVAILATLAAGGAYVPLDPAYPAERLAFMMADARVSVLLTDAASLPGLPATSARLVRLDTVDLAGESAAAPASAVGPGHAAYVIYTSGSTGRPKGVVVEHRGLGNLAAAQAQGFAVTSGSRVLQFASTNFDASVSEILVTLLAGATLVLAPQEAMLPGPELVRTLTENAVSVVTLPPSALAALPDALLPALRTLVVAGEACTEDLVARWAPGRLFVNAYGPTENTVCATMAACEPGGGRPSIGRPIANVRVYILDPRGAPAPVGVPGELHLAGVGLARGYLNQPELTAARFVASALPEEPGARLYRTGDLCRYRADGQIEFLGRIDHQVKLRGYRIELGEIEAVLAEQAGVREALVVARADGGDARLVAYLVPAAGAALDAADLKRRLREKLPEYMVPAAFVTLAALPVSPSGKVDRAALPAPEAGAAGAVEDAGEPRGPVEEAIAGIFAEVLRLPRVGSHDSFFDLGGHSLLGTQVMARVRDAFAVDVPLRRLFESATPAGLAATVQALLRAGQGVAAPPLGKAPPGGDRPLSFAQERLWFLAQLQPDDASYNIPLAIRMEGALDVPALAAAVGDLVARHEVLRTSFTVTEGRPAQRVHDASPLELPVIALAGEDALRGALAAESARPFDLAAGPAFRARLFALAPEDHVLQLVVHHACADGWSMGVLTRELGAAYEARRAGRAPALPPLPVQYADYAAWQRGWLAGPVLDAQLAYWKDALGGAPAALELPTDRPRPPVQTHAGARRALTLPPELAAALRALSRRRGATLFMTLLAAFDVLLARYTGEGDIAVGTPIAGRTHAETEPLIGCFLNTLVLRTAVDESLSASDLIARVKSVCLGAYAHQDMPFERLVQELAPERDLGRSPLFQVSFALQNTPRSGLRLGDLALRGAGGETVTAKFDLSLVMNDAPAGLTASFLYNTDLFDAATIERMLEQLGLLLRGIVAAPEAPVRDLAMLPPGERELLLTTWNETAAPRPEGVLLHHLVEAQARRTPEAVAVVFEGQRLSYRELDARAGALAARLQDRGVGPDVLVGVAMDRSLELPVALLAVLKAGGAYVPIDPSYPAERIAFMLDDTRAPVVLAQAHVVPLLGAAAARALVVDADPGPAAAPRPVATGPDHLAYVIYTSGSTGRPKGAMISHRSIVNHMLWMGGAFPLGAAEAVLQKTPISFDASVWEFWLPLMGGARLVMARPEGHRDAAYLVRAVLEHGITDLQLVPSALEVLLLDPDLPRTGTLARLFVGGEALRRSLVERFQAQRDVPVVNLYGPSECTVQAVVGTAQATARGAFEPIGRPIDNARVYVVDAALSPVPIGVPGELVLGGLPVGRGYLNRAELTAERFVESPFVAGDRLYRTGDRCRYRADGVLEYLGRADNQVKLRGFRVELGEIEAALAQHPAVREAAVIVREDTPGDQRLVAYVVARAATPSPAELREALRARLPDYMVPTAFVALDALPLTPSGKLDRRALPAPEGGLDADASAAPRGPVEEALVRIFAEVLRLPAVGARDGFFTLGGHSLLATQVISRIRAAFAVELPLRALFEAPTPAELGRRIEEALHGGQPRTALPIAAVARGATRPLSFAEERIWFLAQLAPEDPSYVVPLPIRLAGAVSVPTLEQALAALVARHEILRTTFALDGARPVATIHAPFAVPVPVTLVAGSSAVEREEALRVAMAAESRRPFDLAVGPLLRARLLTLDEGASVLFLTLHHVVCDAWTAGILRREIAALHAAAVAGRPAALPELALQYADYAAWQRGFLAGDVLASELAFWKAQLAGAPAALELPADRPRPAIASHRGAHASFLVRPELAAALVELSRREGATLFMTLLAAFEAFLCRYTGQSDLVVGTPIAGRTRAETESLVGFFLNMLVLRTQVEPALPFRDVLQRVKETCLAAYAHQDMPFEGLVEALAPQRDLGRAPLFQVLFTLQSAPPGAGRAGRGALEEVVESGTAKFDLSLSFIDGPGGLRGTFEYATDLFDAATVTRMTAELVTLLEGIVAAPGRTVREVPLLPEEERRLLLDTWNDTRAAYPDGVGLPALLTAQAERTPDALAVSFEGRDALSYRALDRRGNQLARHLRARGVGAGARVGIAVERGVGMVVGLLGILKAGAAYVPLDPTYPRERIAFMAGDAGLAALVTEEALSGVAPEAAGVRVSLDGDAAAIAAESEDALDGGPDAGAVAYVIYTSGSTGKPKGVSIAHRALVNFLTSMAREPGLTAADRLLAVTSLSFDIAGLEIWLPLLVGAHVDVASRETASDGAALARRLAEGRISVVQATPTTFRLLLDAGFAGDPALRVLVGGEAVPRDLVDRLGPRVAALWNMYGPTETTIWSCVQRLQEGAPVLIGRPIANTRVYVLDPAGQPAPIGVPGELYLGGDGVALGYLDRPELTRERFVPDPFAGEGARLYRTGDLVRWRPSGALEFLGRIDFQVKLRGFRIELGEIEAVLARAPGVREAVVTVRTDGPGEGRIVAYVTAVAGAAVVPAALRAHLKEALPDYMVPAVFVALERMPLTANNKIDRRALPAPEASADAEESFDAPVGPVAEAIAGIFAEVLRLPRVGARDGFFDRGGHSLLAAGVVARVRAAFGVDLPLRVLFEAPTVAGLAGRVEALLRAGGGAAPPPLGRAPRDRELLLSFGQERFWFLNQLEPGNQAYLMPVALRLGGALDRDALGRALAEVVRRHELLRTVYVQIDDHPVAVILEDHRPALRVVTAPEGLDGQREVWLKKAMAAELAEPFDFAAAPPLRATLFALGAAEHLLLLTLHHIVTDAWSNGILNRELSALYEAFRAGRPSPLPELRLQYADYAQWQRAFLSGDEADRQLAYWRDQLASAPTVLDLPTDRPRPPVRSTRGARRPVEIPAELAAGLRELCRREGVTLFMLLLAGYQAVLHRHTGQDDILVGSPIATRTHAETEGLIGFFINVLVLRARLAGGITARALLAQVKETCLGAYAHQDTPFERLVQELAPDRDLSRPPLVQASFVLQNAPREAIQLPGLRQRSAAPERTTAQDELWLSLTEMPDGIRGTIEYAADLFDAATVDRLIDHLLRILAGMVTDAGVAVGDLPMLGAAEREQLLVTWNASAAPAPVVACAHDLVSAQAARAPEAAALLFEGQGVTYGELEARANRLARYLRNFGVGRESVVGVAVGRSPAAIVALLAVMKAGGAYLPLDPTLPEERLRFMMEDAGLTVLVSEDRVLDDLPGVSVPAIAVDGSAAMIDAESAEPLPPLATPDSAAYVIYTSGSTGKPKGVVVEHRGLGNLAAAQARVFGVAPGSRVLQFASLNFDASVSEIVVTLAAGATLVLAAQEAMLPGPDLARTLVDCAVSVVTLPPSALAVLPVGAFPALRTLVVAGEACPEEIVNRWAPGRCFVDAYGPTEATVCATMGECAAGGGKPSIGRPMDNVRVYVLDARGGPVPVGVPGELHIGGVGVARGYLHRPELTAERFVADPFAGGRMYRSGDRARWLPDGRLDFLGRVDHQVKLRGYRVELGEIEAWLLEHGDVREAAVVLREDRPGDQRLVAYVVPHAVPAPEAVVLRDFLAARVPSYMIPSAFVMLAALPLGATGKIDRRALPAPEAAEGGLFVAPRTETERTIATIWQEVIGVPRVGADDDFFELGGHSLLATQVMTRISEAMGIELPLAALFEVKTVGALAEVADIALLSRHAPAAGDMEEGEL
jgi:amino acid adenylation domain-containing protein